MTSTASLTAELEHVHERWTPRVVGRVNDQYVKVAKLLGELVWHDHPDEDEMFLVVYGELRIELEGQDDGTVPIEHQLGSYEPWTPEAFPTHIDLSDNAHYVN